MYYYYDHRLKGLNPLQDLLLLKKGIHIQYMDIHVNMWGWKQHSRTKGSPELHEQVLGQRRDVFFE